jgi:hypothetical protein
MQQFRDTCDAIALATGVMREHIPEGADKRAAQQLLHRFGLARGILVNELHNYLYKLYEQHTYAGQLAILAAIEGDVRQLVTEVVEDQRYAPDENLRNVLRKYRDGGLPDRFRSLIEEFLSAMKVRIAEREPWKKLVDYRNWLAHGRKDDFPRAKIPTQSELEQEVKRALQILTRAMRNAIKP